MYQYRTLRCYISKAEEEMTSLSYQGWRLVSLTFEKYEQTPTQTAYGGGGGGGGGAAIFGNYESGGAHYNPRPVEYVQGIVAIFKRQVA